MPKKNAGGRPSLYREEYCEQLIEHMKDGRGYDAFAGVIRVGIRTIHDWEKNHPAWADAKAIGFAVCMLWWDQQGRDGLFAGKQFNVAAWIYNMKVRFKGDWLLDGTGTNEDQEPPGFVINAPH